VTHGRGAHTGPERAAAAVARGRAGGAIALAAAALAAAAAAPATAGAAQLLVDDDGAQCPMAAQTTLAGALAAAAPGDVVTLCDGTYRTPALELGKPVSIRGAGTARTVVVPAGALAAPLLTVTAPLTLTDLTIAADGGAFPAAVQVTATDATLARTALVRLGGAAGVRATGAGALTVRDGVLAGYGPAAVALAGAGRTGAVDRDRITGVGAFSPTAQAGVAVTDGAAVVVAASEIAGNRGPAGSAGVLLHDAAAGASRITATAIQGNDPGVVNQPAAPALDARGTWWGAADGPTAASSPGGHGDRAGDGVDFSGFLTAPPAPPEPPADAPPTVTVSPPGRPAPQARPFDVAADASDDRGIRWVRFLIGERVACTVTDAPYRCTIEPRGADVGRRQITAIATDTGGATATALTSHAIGRFDPVSLSSTSRVARKRRVTTTGRLHLPGAVTAAEGCHGEVEVTYRRGRRAVSRKRAALSATCAFRLRRTLPRGSYRIKPRMVGSDVLLPKKGRERRVRVR
jgi:hypothetical protein